MNSSKNTLSAPKRSVIEVDVIIPVHNASETIQATVDSAMNQIIPVDLRETMEHLKLVVFVCCYDDGSTDDSWEILQDIRKRYDDNDADRGSRPRSDDSKTCASSYPIESTLLIARSPDGLSRGAGFARNRAVDIRGFSCDKKAETDDGVFLCLLDSDDVMHPTRVAEQIRCLVSLPPPERERTLLGCQLDRDPPGSTWHYTEWANGLADDRLLLERYREVTVLQPTWMVCRSRFRFLGGYVEAPSQAAVDDGKDNDEGTTATTCPTPKNDANAPDNSSDGCREKNIVLKVVHPTFDTPKSLRLAEDLRFFHSHLHADGLLRLLRTETPLVTYRHRANQSQSFQTSRKLLLHLRAFAFENCVLQRDAWNGSFVVWGAGRDGKEFVKALSDTVRKRVYCFVDVDPKKLGVGEYQNKELGLSIPIIHFAWLVGDEKVREGLLRRWNEENKMPGFGRIDKSGKLKNQTKGPRQKKRKLVPHPKPISGLQRASGTTDWDSSILPKLPVVVCVSMYRTNGVLERNVRSIGRTEGDNLWHFS